MHATHITAVGTDGGIRHAKKFQRLSGQSADDDVDFIIFKQWRLHLVELPIEVAKLKGWNSHY